MSKQVHDGGFIAWFDPLTNEDVPRVGGKNASLGEMVRTLGASGVCVPQGFATTADAYRAYVAANEIAGPLRTLMRSLEQRVLALHEAGEAARRLFLGGEFPVEIADQIREAYWSLSQRGGVVEASVAVRSSATAEDLPDASFAGQQETFLNVRGEREVLDACRRCYASLFTDRAISYRQAKGFDHMEVALSIGVQRMVRSDLGAAGVMFSIDTETGFPRAAVINANWGLGERWCKARWTRTSTSCSSRCWPTSTSRPSSRRRSAPRSARWSTRAAAARARRRWPRR